VFVHTRAFERRLSDVPDGIVPTAPPPAAAPVPGALRDSVIPDGEVRVVGVAGFGAGYGAGRVAAGREAVREGAGAGVSAAGCSGVAGTSWSCGCAAVSRPASCRSRFSAVSCASEVSFVLSEPEHAASDNAARMANGAAWRRI
jgi:hypothetical protein